MSQTLIYDLDKPQLTDLFASWGEPVYRAGQVWQGLYRHFYVSPEQFSALPKYLRERLSGELDFAPFVPRTVVESSDRRTRKTLLQLRDGRLIEAVLMRYESRQTLCISTQAGCAMGCVFCATGQMGFHRHLTSGEIAAQVTFYARQLAREIAAQVTFYARQLAREGTVVTNVVLMGMGEPFHNYENTLAAIDRLNDGDGMNLGARRFTISSVGLVPGIRRFADEMRQVNLAISLHAADDESRAAMLPVNRRHKIKEVLDACRYYVEKTGRRITFEWALIQGVNDTPEVAARLAALLKGLLCHVNAIPLNPTAGYSGQPTDRARSLAFKAALERAGVPCTIRVRRGIEIQAGCGQLAGGLELGLSLVDGNESE